MLLVAYRESILQSPQEPGGVTLDVITSGACDLLEPVWCFVAVLANPHRSLLDWDLHDLLSDHILVSMSHTIDLFLKELQLFDRILTDDQSLSSLLGLNQAEFQIERVALSLSHIQL